MTDAELNDWKTDSIMGNGEDGVFGGFDGTIDPSTMHGIYHFNDKSMENDFDFDNATSSPNPFATSRELGSPEMPTIKYDTTKESPQEMKSKASHHNKTNSVSKRMYQAIHCLG